ncbi:MATE family efflux transporter [Flavobacterium soli]|uniref:hypothetical protein n=1 Tax=Flavobacterium soli TaxID=344881 RepID=UPI000426207E|nr:hypothetical protein [Flavobacterium soli]
MSSKNLNRIGFISSNSVRQLLNSVFAMAIPFMAIHFSTKEIWGEFVSILLFSLIAIQFFNWGNKEYLLRAFSKMPNEISTTFTTLLFTRLPLVVLFSIIGIWNFKTEFGIYIFLWFLGRYLIHSFEVLIIYEKKFISSVVIETLCFLVFFLSFYCFRLNFDVEILLILYSLYQLLKGSLYLILFKGFLNFKNIHFDFNYYKISIWFFLLSFIGFLASKIDVYIIESFGNKLITSDYQIINSLLVFTMSIAAFIYTPFIKNIYRNSEEMIIKANLFISLTGLIIIPMALFIISMILYFFLKLELDFWFFIIAFFYVYPSYIYGIEIVSLFKQHREKKVFFILFIGAIANFILSYVFLYLNFGISGALLGSALSQTIVLFLFKFKNNVKQ